MRKVRTSLALLFRIFFLSLLIPGSCLLSKTTVPQVTLIVVLDQAGYYQINRLRSLFSGGFKKLMQNGLEMTHAIHPHGLPSTAAGHASLATGTLPSVHGAVGNFWFDQEGEAVCFAQDCSTVPGGVSRSDEQPARPYLRVDSFSDQFALHHQDRVAIYALSHKARASKAMAGSIGTAIWFDRHEGGYRSAEQFGLLDRFNKSFQRRSQELSWELEKITCKKRERFQFADNYDFAGDTFFKAGDQGKQFESDLDFYTYYLRSPQALYDLFDLGYRLVEESVEEQLGRPVLLWLSVSSLDAVGHIFGPDSLESIDYLFKIDRQLGQLVKQIESLVGRDELMLALTADHGTNPIPELMKLKGMEGARRIINTDLKAVMNRMVEEEYDLVDYVEHAYNSSFYYRHDAVEQATEQQRKKIDEQLKEYLLGVEGISQVWTPEELGQNACQDSGYLSFYKNHLYNDRFGDLIAHPEPYVHLTSYKKGTSHNTPYHYNTHVPLFFYNRKLIKPGKITGKVAIPQVTPTLAQLLGMTPPVGATYQSFLKSVY